MYLQCHCLGGISLTAWSVLPDLLSLQKEQAEQRAEDEDFRLPINQRIEDSLDEEGLQMASLHEVIPESNKGFQMLQRMGWKGQGLGSKEDGTSLPRTGFQNPPWYGWYLLSYSAGIVEPVGGGQEGGRLGLGKQEEDNFYTASDNIQRKRLETEIQADEDASRTAMREVMICLIHGQTIVLS